MNKSYVIKEEILKKDLFNNILIVIDRSGINNKRKFVIISAMALISRVQNEYRKIKNNFDVYLDVSISELERRDTKGLYKKFRNKEIKNMSGLDLKFDKPKNPNLYLKWKKDFTAYKMSKKILKLINNDSKKY